MEVDEVMLDLDTAIPCGLIINELVSNALKHAFSAGRAGKVCVSLHSHGDQLALTVSDDGVGLPDDLDYRSARSMGLQLVNTLVEQLEGTLGVESAERGTVFSVTFVQPQREVGSRYGN
jgi:two-component sensor histidine kinase